MTKESVNKLTKTDADELYQQAEAAAEYKKYNKIFSLYPDSGPLRRELYRKHLQFFAAGATHQERAVIAANRSGKSFGIGGYETTLHLTGLYPDFWEGRRFHAPIEAWAAGDTSETTRDIIQQILMGNPGEFGTGLIPRDCILSCTHRAGVAQAVDTVRVRHATGGTSWLGFRSYDQGRAKFQGTTKDLCLHGDTLVITESGRVPIKDLVGTKGKVLTDLRTFESYKNCRKTGSNKGIVEVSFSDGASVHCTPDHKFLTKYGWMEAYNLVGKHCRTASTETTIDWLPKVESVEERPNADVYCMSVPSRRNFAVESGIIVSNCWLDEEPPLDVYTECLTRLMTRNGLMMCTFTPLKGLSDVVLMYLPFMAPDTNADVYSDPCDG
jgi:phage terminase large subunit-like protein